MNKKPKKEWQTKRPYRKPEIKQVVLRPEEAVLGGCKNDVAAGPGYADCQDAFTNPCSARDAS